jgi:uncharacterized NAD(P)/FAD-binding protein YdhS
MVDVALELRLRGHRAVMHALSRHGLLPQIHRLTNIKPSFEFLLKSPVTVRKLFRAVRNEIQASARAGHDWRLVLDSLRSITQHLWRTLTYEERRRFLRHVRHYWEAHRHRMAPEVAAQVSDVMKAGHLSVHAGRLQDYREHHESVEVLFRERGSADQRSLRVGYVINCTGPDNDVRRINDPLIRHLRERGYIRPDPLGLGLDAAEDGALIAANNEQSNTLYAIGALRKGDLWETNAVPELRVQADRLAGALARSLRPTFGVGSGAGV